MSQKEVQHKELLSDENLRILEKEKEKEVVSVEGKIITKILTFIKESKYVFHNLQKPLTSS